MVCAQRLCTGWWWLPSPLGRGLEVVHLQIPRVLRQGHSCWLVKKDLVSLQTGFTQSGQLRVNCVEHSLFDWMCECTRSAKACKTQSKSHLRRDVCWPCARVLRAPRENCSGCGFFSTEWTGNWETQSVLEQRQLRQSQNGDFRKWIFLPHPPHLLTVKQT